MSGSWNLFYSFLFRRGGKQGLGKYSLCLAFRRVLNVLVLPSRLVPAQLLQEPCAVCPATYSNSCDENEMRIVEEAKQAMRQERWSSSECSTGPTSCWVNSLLNFWEGGQKSRATLIKIFSSFHTPRTNELLPLPLAFMFREIWGYLYLLLHIGQHSWNGLRIQMLLGRAEAIMVSSAAAYLWTL